MWAWMIAMRYALHVRSVVVMIAGAVFNAGVILLPYFFHDDAQLMRVDDMVCILYSVTVINVL